MIISHRLKYVYVHLPKTGGTSIKNVLLENDIFSFDERGSPNRSTSISEKYPCDKMCKLFYHASIKEVNDYLIESDKNPDEYFKFAFIRNPWDMIVSNFEYYKQVMSKLPYIDEVESRKITAAQKCFKDFVNLIPLDWTNDRIFINGIVGVDYLAKFENIQQESQFIFKTILGTNYKPVPVPHMNATIRKPYQEYYDNELKQLVQNKFEAIIQLGEYVF